MSASERTWERLAKARPASLDPAPDPARRERDLARALAAGQAAGQAGRPAPVAATGIGDEPGGRQVPSTREPRWTVAAAIGSRADRVPGKQAGRRRPARRGGPSARKLTVAIAVGTVAAVGAVVVLPWFGPDGSAPAPPPDRTVASSPTASPPAPASARQVLLAAAAEAGRAAGAATGRSWQTRTESATVEPVNGADYLIELRWREEYLVDPATGRGTWTRTELGARPARPADAAAWRRAGSPQEWRITVPGPCPSDAEPTPEGCTAERTVSAQPGKPVSLPLDVPGGGLYSLAGRNVTADDLARLPTDPARLKAKLLEGYDGCGTESCGDEPVGQEDWLFENAGGLVIQMPVTPQVRAAAFRMLADLPGMTVLPAARDALGREAVAVAIRATDRTGAQYERRLLIDPENWAGLAMEQHVIVPDPERPWAEPGLRTSYTALESAGWTGN